MVSGMTRQLKLQRAEDKIGRLSGQGLDMVAFWRACAPVLADAVPHYQAPCCDTLDPASRLVTSHFQEGLPEFPAEWAAQEYADDDVNHLADVARTPSGISTLDDATNGNPSISPRWHANMAYGGDQELIAALRTRGGEVWVRSVCTASPIGRCSIRPSWLSSDPSASRWPTASAADSSSERQPTRRERRRRA